MEPAYLSEAERRTADFMHTYTGDKIGTAPRTVMYTGSVFFLKALLLRNIC